MWSGQPGIGSHSYLPRVSQSYFGSSRRLVPQVPCTSPIPGAPSHPHPVMWRGPFPMGRFMPLQRRDPSTIDPGTPQGTGWVEATIRLAHQSEQAVCLARYLSGLRASGYKYLPEFSQLPSKHPPRHSFSISALSSTIPPDPNRNPERHGEVGRASRQNRDGGSGRRPPPGPRGARDCEGIRR